MSAYLDAKKCLKLVEKDQETKEEKSSAVFPSAYIATGKFVFIAGMIFSSFARCLAVMNDNCEIHAQRISLHLHSLSWMCFFVGVSRLLFMYSDNSLPQTV